MTKIRRYGNLDHLKAANYIARLRARDMLIPVNSLFWQRWTLRSTPTNWESFFISTTNESPILLTLDGWISSTQNLQITFNLAHPKMFQTTATLPMQRGQNTTMLLKDIGSTQGHHAGPRRSSCFIIWIIVHARGINWIIMRQSIFGWMTYKNPQLSAGLLCSLTNENRKAKFDLSSGNGTSW